MQRKPALLFSLLICLLPLAAVCQEAGSPEPVPQEAPPRPDWLLGFGAGITWSGSVGSLYSHPEFVRVWPVVGYAARAAVEYAPIPTILWVEAGVGIERLGHGYLFVGSTTNASYEEIITYLTVPLTAKTAFRLGPGDLTLGLGGGVAVALFTGGTRTDETTSFTSRLADAYFDGYLTRVNGFIQTAAGYEFPSPIGRFGLELIVDIHLVDDFEWNDPVDGNRFLTGRILASYRIGFHS